MMKFIPNALFLLVFLSACAPVYSFPPLTWGAHDWHWSTEGEAYMPHAERDPYLEFEKHTQVAQWSHQDWVAEDWISQYGNPKDIIAGFYKADILRDQFFDNERKVLVVGSNFYHLSGFDKRRVAHVVDVIYGITKSSPEGAFFLKDWKTGDYIGVYDRFGLRLH